MYNEASVIEESASAFLDALSAVSDAPVLVFSDDGSTDDTVAVARAWLARTGTAGEVVTAPHNQGKGAALSRGLARVQTPWSAIIDADLEIPAAYLVTVLQAVMEGADVCAGVKSGVGASSQRALFRKVLHHGYNGLVRVALGSPVQDHSCGLKAFRKEVLDAVLPTLTDAGFTWDTEFLVRAQMAGFTVQEVPIHTVFRRVTSARLGRVAWTSLWAVADMYRRGVRVPR